MRSSLEVLGRVLSNPRLRRVELAFLGFGAAEYGVWVAVLVYAYERGGTTTAAVIAVVQLVPAAILAPAAARLVDRHGGALALRAGYRVQCACLAGTGSAFFSGAPPGLGYACATLAASAVTLTRPAQGALLPELVERPSELTAANAVSSWVESVSMLAGPVLTGVLIALDGPGLAVGAFAAVLAVGAALVAGVGRPGAAPPRAQGDADVHAEAAAGRAGATVFEVCASNRAIPAVLALFMAQFAAEGATDVLVVVLAVKVIGLGTAGASYLQATFGAGAVLGGVGALALVGRRTLGGPLVAAAAAWALAFIALGGWHSAGAAFAFIAVAGASRTVLGAAGRTLLHRAVPAAVHGRVFGVLEGLAMAGLAIGSLSVPALVAVGGVRAALVGAGGALLAVAVTVVAAVRRLDDGTAVSASVIALLRRCSVFALLGAPVLEDIARAVVTVALEPGAIAVRESERGDRFYVVAEGSFEVSIGGVHVRDLHRGEGFGEIALLRDGIRTATVRARGPAAVYEIGRTDFLAALGTSTAAARVAGDVMAARLEASLVR